MGKKRPHIVCVPFPAQGHINPMMQLARLLRSRGFFTTFVNTEFIHKRLITSKGLESLEPLDGFRFESISDGLPPYYGEIMDDLERYCRSVQENCVAPFHDLLKKLHHSPDGHPISCVVSDCFMSFTLEVAAELGIPEMMFCPAAVSAFMAFAHYRELIARGFAPIKDESYLTNGYLDTTIDWMPGLKEMRLRDLGSFLRTTDANDYFLNFVADVAKTSFKAPALIFNTFDDLEHQVLLAIRSMFPGPIYTIGPLFLQCQSVQDNELKSVKTSMWKEDTKCLKWLDNYKTGSVIYVNFGSTTVTTSQQLIEFAWGLVNSNHPFLWVLRCDLVKDGLPELPEDFMKKIEGRGMLVSWCPQLEVLAHPSIGGFLTHCGWNSTLESICYGVPMLCWPFFAEQQNNCFFACKVLGVGMEVENSAKREEISDLIKEFMEGKKGKQVREKALKWKESAQVATKEGGSSFNNLELLIHKLVHPREQ